MLSVLFHTMSSTCVITAPLALLCVQGQEAKLGQQLDFGDFGYFGHIQAISRNRIVQITNNGIGDRLALYEYTDDDQTPSIRLDSDHGACSSGPTEYDQTHNLVEQYSEYTPQYY